MMVMMCISMVPMNSFATESAQSAEILYSGTDGDLDWSIDSNGHLEVTGNGDLSYADSYAPEWCEYSEQILTATVVVSEVTCLDNFFHFCPNLRKVQFGQSDTSDVRSMKSMFVGCDSLQEVDFGNCDTSNVTDMTGMFMVCGSLKELDLSNFNTANVLNMSHMFGGCYVLESIDISSFDTSKVTDMYSMFESCNLLQDLDLKNFDTSQVTLMSRMFMGCNSIQTLDLSGFDTSQVTRMENMFSGCNSIQTLDLSGFNTSQVTSMECMFSGCNSIQTLDLSGFDTSQVTSMTDMFDGCSSLSELNVSNFNTSNVSVAAAMFKGCGKLRELDLSTFDLSHPTYMYQPWGDFFEGCTSLSVIKTPSKTDGSIVLPVNAIDWTDSSGTVYTKLPKNPAESIELRCGTWPVSISGYSISLNGDIAVNFYMNLSDEIIADTTAYMQFTMPNGDVSKVMVSDAKVDATSGNYVFPCDVSAAEMTDEITAEIITTVWDAPSYTYSVKTYADYILAHTDVAEYAKAAPLVKAMLNYGGYSQKQFNHNTDTLANADLYTTDTDPVLNDAVSIADTYAFTTPSNDIGLKYYGSSLLLNSKTTIRQYFTITGGESLNEIAEKYTFELEDETILAPKMKSGMICVDIEDINAPDLDEVFNLTVTNTATDGTITFGYSPMTYAKYVLDYSLSGQNLVNVIKAMYWYNQAANEYFV